MEITKIDRLFAAKALIKTLQKEVDALESECKGELLEQYLEDGETTQKRSRFFGNKAGCLSISQGEPKKEVREYVADRDEVMEWFAEEKPDTTWYAKTHLDDFCSWWLRETGEAIPGFNRIEYIADPGMPTAKLTVREKVVMPILREQGMLEGSVRFLLGDGE